MRVSVTELVIEHKLIRSVHGKGSSIEVAVPGLKHVAHTTFLLLLCAAARRGFLNFIKTFLLLLNID